MTAPKAKPAEASSFATRRAAREAREAAGEVQPSRRFIGIPAGENPIVTVHHV